MFKDRLYPIYARLARPNHHQNRRATDRGRMVQTSMIISAALGIDTNLNLVYQLFALLLCLLIVSRLALRLQPPRVDVSRDLPHFATAGQTFDYTLRVTNLGQKVETDLQVIDNLAIKAPSLEEFQQLAEPGEETRNAYDRTIGFHRFMWLLRRNSGVTLLATAVPDLGVKSTALVSVTATPLRRGIVHFDNSSILYSDPFGLYLGLQYFKDNQQLLVLPRRYSISPRFELPGRSDATASASTMNANVATGDSDEFISLRDYREGDPLRRVHWLSSAKRGKPVIKEFQREHFARHTLVVDSALDDTTIFEEVISVAASLLLAVRGSARSMDLLLLARQAQHLLADQSGTSQLQALALLQSSSKSFNILSEACLGLKHDTSGYVLVLGAWDQARQSLLQKLQARQTPVTIFFVCHSENEFTDLPTHSYQLPVGEIQEKLASL